MQEYQGSKVRMESLSELDTSFAITRHRMFLPTWLIDVSPKLSSYNYTRSRDLNTGIYRKNISIIYRQNIGKGLCNVL